MPKTPQLTPANQNPWYVLMTLYGEQDRFDFALRDQNRAVWNRWSCQRLDDDAAADLARQADVDPAETRGWADIAEEVKEKHRAEMERRNAGSDFTYPGFPDVEDAIDCSRLEFSNRLNLRNCIFTQGASFPSATFTQGADFFSATFTQTASFSFATFTQGANFPFATFTQGASFPSATFTQGADFFSATFTQNANFYSAIFTQDAYFYSATFMQDAYFASATFTQGAYFASATFTQGAHFASASFDGPAKFLRARFGLRDSADMCVPDFTEASFARIASFRAADFAHHYPVLEGTEFRESVVVTTKPNYWPDPKRRLLRVAAEGEKRVPTYEVAKESCAALRHALAKQGRPEEEHFFFKREMHNAARAEPWLKTLHIYLFGWVSDYGYSIARPANFLLALCLLGAFIFSEWAGYYENGTWVGLGVGESLGYSFSNMFKFFGLHRTYFDFEVIRQWPAWVQWASGVQTVLAFILLFFLGLGLRTRFRLR